MLPRDRLQSVWHPDEFKYQVYSVVRSRSWVVVIVVTFSSLHCVFLPVTPEAIGFLSAVGVFVVLLAVLALFINKKLCFETLRGHPHLEQRGKRKQSLRDKTGGHPGLGKHHVLCSPEPGNLMLPFEELKKHLSFQGGPIRIHSWTGLP